MKFTALIIAAGLTGCALAPGSAVTPSVSTQLAIAKSEYAAEALFKAAEQAYLVGETKLDAADKLKAKTLLLQILDCPQGSAGSCTGYLDLARKAMAASDANTLAQQIAEITTLAGEITTLVKGN